MSAYTGFIQMRAAQPTSVRVFYRLWLQNSCTNMFYVFMDYRDIRTDSTPPGLAARREHGVRREGKKDRPAGAKTKYAYPTLRERRESK